MPQNYTGRLTIIIGVVLVALWAIFPQGNLKEPNLKPGIDMVGGTSLLYEIKQPPGGYHGPKTLSEEVMESLKKRVDPQGVRNLIWRPQGNTRLEIQMPASKGGGNSAAKRDAFAAAQRRLEATNVRTTVVLNAVEKMTGEARAKKLADLAMDSATRKKLFADLVRVHDEIQQASQAKNAELQAKKEIEYDALKNQIDDTNLPSDSLESMLTAQPSARADKLAELKKKFADFPERVAAVDQFDKALAEYDKVKGSLDDAQDLKRLLRGSGVLEFHILVTDYESPEVKGMTERLKKRGPVVEANDTMRWFPIDNPDEFKREAVKYGDKSYALASIKPEDSMDNRPGKARWSLESARSSIDQQNGQRVVNFTFDPQGAKYFSEMTGSHLPRPDGRAYQLAIMLDDKLISAPNINSRIGANGQITGGGDGGFSEKDAGYLVSTLNAGSLPAQLAEQPISERTVGPQLGADNLRRGLQACGVGLIIVAIFLISYYYLAGVVAVFAVLLNVLIILGVMAMFNATFTLPGVAGIVLTIGAAVDANVLIFERLREEQHRGLSLRMALRNSYDRAFSAIVDSNATTVITSLVLYWLGSEDVKGFGLTLLIGLLSSLFTALFVTKTIFGLLIDKFGLDHLGSLPLTFPKWDRALQPKIDWMKLVPWFATFSAVVILLGCVAFVVKTRQGEMADIEFASGTSVQFELKEPLPIDKVRARMPQDDPRLPSVGVVSVGTDNLVYEVVTPNPKSPEVTAAILEKLGDSLKLERPSDFEGMDQPADAVMDKQIFAITGDTTSVGGLQPPELSSYIGGAAVVLSHLDPPLEPTEIHKRIERERMQPQAVGTTPAYRDFTVVAEGGPNQPATTAVVLVNDPNIPNDKDPFKFKEEVVTPMWKLIKESVHNPPKLQKVTNFDAQVAGDARTDALLALTLSVVIIMAYIWFRFGNLKYGTATVVAMIHDTLLVLAAIGLSHYLANSAIGRGLLIEPFRINLTLVAAILTVMSYSMIDTIVVFDRVRENRGKFGHLSRQIVNDSINQTMSRTLLTGSTNMMTVLVMYIMGGSGIHGFTFVLLVGILVGTYSSIAIAAPLLLVGGSSEDGGSAKSRRAVATKAKSSENAEATPVLVGRASRS